MKEIKKRQHYYPRCLLKYFADDNKNVHEYNVQSKTFRYVKYDSICYHNYTYETEKNSSSADNLLEDQFAEYEAKIGPIIDDIVNNCWKEGFKITGVHRNALIDYLWLQTNRTDAGRLKYMNNTRYSWGYDKKGVVTNEEIEVGESKIREFNEIFKNKNGLKNMLSIFEPSHKTFCLKIGVTDAEFITSDNPVVTDLGSDKNSPISYMPISSNIVLIFEYERSNIYRNIEELVVPVSYRGVNWINTAIINTSNYSIISNNKFGVALTGYIKNRFENPNWQSPFEIVY